MDADQLRAVSEHPLHGGALLVGELEVGPVVAEVEDQLDAVEQLVPILLGYTEQEADRLHRQFGGHVQQEVEPVARPELSDQRLGAASQVLFQPPDGTRGQTLADQTPDPSVSGVVHHVEHRTGDGEVQDQRPTVLARPTCLR